MDHPDDGMATCTIDPINIALAMLKAETVKSAFKYLATGSFQLRPNAWFLQGRPTEERATCAGIFIPACRTPNALSSHLTTP